VNTPAPHTLTTAELLRYYPDNPRLIPHTGPRSFGTPSLGSGACSLRISDRLRLRNGTDIADAIQARFGAVILFAIALECSLW